MMHARGAGVLLSICLLAAAGPAAAADSTAVEPGPRERMRAEARALPPLVKSEAVRRFLNAIESLPAITPRTLLQDTTAARWYGAGEARALADTARARMRPREVDEGFYYDTRYGTPLAYARALDLVAQAGLADFAGARVLDFGYGTIGHLRLLASLGAEVTGVEVDPVLRALYSEPGDQGVVPGRHGRDGRVTLLHGHWPGDAPLRTAAAGGYRLVMSKNTLKNGYIHPERPVDPRRLVHLEVSDSAFVRAVWDALAPGGFFLIYNLSPAPSPPDQPYKPWADGRCPFARTLLESQGFEVLEFDRDDSETARAMGRALGWNQGPSPMDLEKDLFGHYMLARRPATKPR
jgi:SAM-dependent methyltransferase